MKLHPSDTVEIIDHIHNLAKENNYTKLFCKIPAWAAPLFLARGFVQEAYIPRFYNGQDDAFFLSKFLDSDRLLGFETSQLEPLSESLAKTKSNAKDVKLPSFKVALLGSSDVEEITQIYREVFISYPFPIHNPGYILKTMKENIQYYGIRVNGKLAALSSAEIDLNGGNAEMTDFATLPEFRGRKLSIVLLNAMEKKMKKQSIFTLYTIARLNSLAMNLTFLHKGYRYAGTLIKNTNISGSIESMNVLYKNLSR